MNETENNSNESGKGQQDFLPLPVDFDKSNPGATILGQITNLMPDIITIIELPSRKILYSNSENLVLQGFNQEELAKMTLEEREKLVHPDDLPALQKFYESFIPETKDDEVHVIKYRAINKQGETLTYFSRGKVFQRNADGSVRSVLNIIQNVTEREKAEAEINRLKEKISKQDAEKYKSLFNSIDDGFAFVELEFNADGKIRDLIYRETNQSFERHTGLVNVSGRRASELLPNLEQSFIDIIQRVSDTGEPIRTEDYVSDLDRWYEVLHARIGEAGSPFVVALFKDVTERKLTERRQEFLLRLSDALRPLSDTNEIEYTACRLLAEHLGVSSAYYPIFNEKEGTAKVERQFKTESAPSMMGVFTLDAFRWSVDILRRGFPIVVDDVTTSNIIPDEQKPAMLAIQQMALISVPLIKKGELIGGLTISENAPRFWKPEEIELVRETLERTWAAAERARSEVALRESEQRLRFTLENAIDYAFVNLDLQQKIIGWSSGAERIFGYDSKEAIGQPFSALFTTDDIAIGLPETKILEAVQKGVAFDERWGVHQNGTQFFLNGVIRPVLNPELSGFVKVARDMTRQKLVEQQKDEFLSTASHELKTPVTSLKMYAEILEERFEKAGDNENAGLMHKMNAQVDRLTRLIRDLLDSSKINEGRLIFYPQTFELNELIRERLEELQLTTSKHQLKFTTDQENISVEADRERIGQVLVNLLSNAIKYSPEGCDIRIEAKALPDCVSVRVEDKGIGIPAESIGRVFERFFRADTASVMHSYPGMGLGLYICAAIIEQHGGLISVESREGEGSVFQFSLPYHFQKKEEH